MTPRYAVYAAPPAESALWRFGSAVIGFDAADGTELAPTPRAGLGAEAWHALTAEPRRYGFHGTLKAPFPLAANRTEEALQAALDAFAAAHAPPPPFPLAVTRLGPFLALCPDGRPAALHALADALVRAFEPFRAPLSPEDRLRRRPEALTERQRRHLDSFGYPYVFEDFRFHMTLTGHVPEERVDAVAAGLREAYATLAPEPFALTGLVLFRQDDRQERFRILSRHPLRARAPPAPPP